MKAFVELLFEMPDFEAGKGCTETEIQNAEGLLHLHFAKEFKDYLKRYGIASAEGHEFTGIINSKRLNVVDVTKRHTELNTNRKGLYVVEDLAIDKIIIWQDAKGVVYQTVGKSDPAVVYKSLSEYLMS